MQLGITLRGADASRHDPAGTHHLIRIGDLSDDGALLVSEPNLIRLDGATARRFELKSGEVLLAARGTRMTAAIFDGGRPAVAGGQFLVIRPRAGVLVPAYLRWFLNLPTTQDSLIAEARGSYVRSLSASALSDLELPVPPLPQQRAIAELHELRLHEKRLMEQLAAHRAVLVDRAILQSLHP
ncbi:MAG: restriction endonuclease subunit S [Verrucomicrobia bacterium]|nr:restriction endonuclease subunit S [Verrucomicrobiota bacterium]